MNKVATGLILGGLVGLAGASYLGMNESARKSVMRKGKKVISKAENVLEDVAPDVW